MSHSPFASLNLLGQSVSPNVPNDPNLPPPAKAGDVSEAMQIVLDTVYGIWRGFLARLPLLGAAVLVLILTWVATLVATIAVRRVLPSSMRESLQELLLRLMRVVIWILGILVACMVIFPGLTPAQLLGALGLASVAIGFAFKDIFENFFAGILILWRFPFENGDFIEVNEIMGQVQEVTIRNTLVRQPDGELVVIPNAKIFNNAVTVMTYETKRRMSIIAGVAYGEDVDEARQVIFDAVSNCKSVSKDKRVEIFANEFGSSSINYEVAWWADPSPLDERSSRDEVVAAIKRALDEAGIEIPFPYRTLTFKEPLHTVASQGNGEGRK
jgi:small-conductance mechanosensitive channel